VYESSGKDDLALNQYMKAKSLNLVYTHPDRAFAFCGLGSVLFHMEEPAWALRLYL
jgi:tetratricopeptide (TPR) repeat protein